MPAGSTLSNGGLANQLHLQAGTFPPITPESTYSESNFERYPTVSISNSSSSAFNTRNDGVAEWSTQQISYRHNHYIWPIAAFLLVFGIITTELQIYLNNIFPGEMHCESER